MWPNLDAWDQVPCRGCGFIIALLKISQQRHWSSVLDTCTCGGGGEQPMNAIERLARVRTDDDA